MSKVYKIIGYSSVPVKTDMEELPVGYALGDLSLEADEEIEEGSKDEDMEELGSDESWDEVDDNEMDALLNINSNPQNNGSDDEWEEVEE